AFVAARRGAGYSTWVSVRSAALPLEYLRELGVVPVAPARVVDDPLERLLAGYGRYLFDVSRAIVSETPVCLDRVFPDRRRRPWRVHQCSACRRSSGSCCRCCATSALSRRPRGATSARRRRSRSSAI